MTTWTQDSCVCSTRRVRWRAFRFPSLPLSVAPSTTRRWAGWLIPRTPTAMPWTSSARPPTTVSASFPRCLRPGSAASRPGRRGFMWTTIRPSRRTSSFTLPGGCIDGFFHDFRFPEFPDRILGFVPVRRQRRVRVGRHAHARPFGDIRRYLSVPLQGHQLDRGEHRQGQKRR